MKPRKMRPKNIPATDVDRAYRFYRDFFDFTRDAQDQTKLIVDGQTLTFEKNDQPATVEIIARDYEEDIIPHFKNYFLKIKKREELPNNKVNLYFKDTEGNLVIVELNNKKPA